MGAVSRFFLILGSAQALGAPLFLSQTTLFDDISSKKIKVGNQSFSPQYPLWTDGASKKRWIHLPAAINVTDPDRWVFPLGTKIWKEFSFEGKRVETRYMEKQGEGEWIFATYLWNPEESEATLASEDGVENYYPLSNGKKHDIPSVFQCLRCHRSFGDPVLGFDALGLSSDRDPLALHAEPLEEGLTLAKLIREKWVTDSPAVFNEGAPVIAAPAPTRSMLGYFHTHCASCHQAGGSAANLGLRLRYLLGASDFTQTDMFLTAVNQYAFNFVIPGETRSLRVAPGAPEKSAFYYMFLTEEASHMPPLGTKVLDVQAMQLLKEWIKNLN